MIASETALLRNTVVAERGAHEGELLTSDSDRLELHAGDTISRQRLN